MALPPLVVIGGATATGKTRLSLEIAEALSAEILGADSRQVYRGMDIGTAKVGPAERSRVPHHGLDLVDPDARFTAADYRRYALGALAGIASRGRAAVVVGGTGLYLRGVARGIPMGAIGDDPIARAELEARLEREGLPSLLAELDALAPTQARKVDRANHRRVIRAIERARVVGDAPPPAPEGYPSPVVWLGLVVEPVAHAAAIEARARAQFAGGLLDEAAGAPGSIRRGSRPVRRDGLPGGIRYAGRAPVPGVRDQPDHRAYPQLRQPTADLVPLGARHPLATARAGRVSRLRWTSPGPSWERDMSAKPPFA